MIFPWGNTRRFNSWADKCKVFYGSRLQRVSIHAGFTCPNRDGSIGVGGCTYCNNLGFSPTYCHTGLTVLQQIDEGLVFLKKRYPRAKKFVAYFQAYSNTYSDLDSIKKLYEEALSHPEIMGLAVGTRPDCIDTEKLEYFANLASQHFFSIEYGVESCYNDTLRKVNRGHTFEDSCRAIEQSAALGLHTGAHIILGLPGETREQMLEQAAILSKLPISSLKVHQLQIVKDTPMALEYAQQPENFHLFTPDEYRQFIISFLERLNPNISIERLAGSVPPDFNAAPVWGGIRSEQFVNTVEKEMERLNTWQGRRWIQSS